MIKSIIVAIASNHVIGKDNDLIWHLPNDLKFFKKTTSGHCIIMGRKTFESFGKPLPNRTHIIITRNPDYQYEGCHVVHSLSDAFALAEQLGEKEAFILGGGQIYAQALPLADRLYITEVHHAFEGDTTFPKIDYAQWLEKSREEHEVDEKHKFAYAFVLYDRVA